MKVQTFNEVRENLKKATAPKPVQPQQIQKVPSDLDQYPRTDKDLWPGTPIYGAQWDHPRLAPDNFYSLPGRRAFVQDCVDLVYQRKMEYYERWFKSFACGLATLTAMFVLPMPFSFIALPLAGFSVFYYFNGLEGKKVDFETWKNFGTIKPIVTDKVGYPVTKAPGALQRMWIWK